MSGAACSIQDAHVQHQATPGKKPHKTVSQTVRVVGAHAVTYIIPIKRNFIRTRIGPSDETSSGNQGKNTNDGCRAVVQTPCPRNSPRPCNQKECSDGARRHRVSNGESDTSSGDVSLYVLVILRVNCRQNNSCAQRNTNPNCAIGFALIFAY
jgi:hypothetical protein